MRADHYAQGAKLTHIGPRLRGQAYSYFMEYHQDPLWMKGLVVLVW